MGPDPEMETDGESLTTSEEGIPDDLFCSFGGSKDKEEAEEEMALHLTHEESPEWRTQSITEQPLSLSLKTLGFLTGLRMVMKTQNGL